MIKVMYSLPSLRQYILFIISLFAIVVLADSNVLEIGGDEIYFDELYDQAGTWRELNTDASTWRVKPKEENPGRIEWGEDYSTYGSRNDDFMSSPNNNELSDPKTATIMRLRF